MYRCVVRVGLVLTVVLSAMFSTVVFAYENEPYEFRGIKWDTNIEKLSDMEIVLDGGDLKAYTKKGDKMKLEEAQLSALHYIFYKDHFYCVHMEFKGLDDFNKIKDGLFKTYGQPEGTRYHDKRFVWLGVNASITLEYDESIGTGELGFKFVPIDKEIVGEEMNQTAEDAE